MSKLTLEDIFENLTTLIAIKEIERKLLVENHSAHSNYKLEAQKVSR